MILVTDLNWYKQTKADNIGVCCEHKSLSKIFDCVKAYYQCKTCTDANGGPRGAKIPVTKRLQLSNGELVDVRTISTGDGSFHATSSITLSKFQKQEVAKGQKSEKEGWSYPLRMLRNLNQQKSAETSYQSLQLKHGHTENVLEEVEYDCGTLQITKSQKQDETDLLSRMYILETAGGSAVEKMVQGGR